MSECKSTDKVQQWGIFELTAMGPSEGNPFIEVHMSAQFRYMNRIVEVEGFYDGDGIYRVRFMPDTQGEWSYLVRSNCDRLDGLSGKFLCCEPETGNHGPVGVSGKFHFSYRDGSRFVPFGTTCYAWNHQDNETEELTLATLKSSPFNKLRMCVFPKHYDYNLNEPVYHAYETDQAGKFDFARFNPLFFRHLENRIMDLQKLGIEADLIIFHPYDRWGYSDMGAEADDRYLRYLAARLAAYRNIWWSLANEYDLVESKTMEDWDRFFRIIQQFDPYLHLRSIHNCRDFYDYGKPWVTHCSIQHSELQKVDTWRELYQKPVVVDECCYEGNINHEWGNITANEMVHRFWQGFLRGGYVGHGETYMHPRDTLWWSKGGVLHGQSPERIAFLKRIVEEGPEDGISPLDYRWCIDCGGKAPEYYLMYFGVRQPSFRDLNLPEEYSYSIELIDTWNMTVEPLSGKFSGKCRVNLPARQYMALRIKKL